MRRRDVAAPLAGAAAAWPLRAVAQPASGLPLVGVLLLGRPDNAKDFEAALRSGLKEGGFVEGTNFSIAIRSANGDFERLAPLAAELAALEPRVIVAVGAAAPAAHTAAPTVPLVFTRIAADPIAMGFVQSYARPGGMVTGNVMNALGGETALTTKRIGLFKELVPELARLGVITIPNTPVFVAKQPGIKAAAEQLGFEIVLLPVQGIDEVAAAFASGLRARVDAFYISGESLLFSNRDKIVELAGRTGKPTVGVQSEWSHAGLLMSHFTDSADGFRRAGVYAAKILAGAKPADLPVEQASKFTFVINLKTAKALGRTVPPTLLALANEVIE